MGALCGLQVRQQRLEIVQLASHEVRSSPPTHPPPPLPSPQYYVLLLIKKGAARLHASRVIILFAVFMHLTFLFLEEVWMDVRVF
jgi:hypothetical protein